MTSKQRLLELKARIKVAKDEAKALIKSAFNEEAQVLFNKYPTLLQFGWTQYTPYFNDGDACNFHTNETAVWFTDDEDVENTLDDSPYEHESYGFSGENKKIADAVNAFLSIFDEADFEEMFGDHMKVLVNRTTGVTTEEYDHD